MFQFLKTVFTNDLTFTLYSPEDDMEYEFCLVACNECGKSPKSYCKFPTVELELIGTRLLTVVATLINTEA